MVDKPKQNRLSLRAVVMPAAKRSLHDKRPVMQRQVTAGAQIAGLNALTVAP